MRKLRVWDIFPPPLPRGDATAGPPRAPDRHRRPRARRLRRRNRRRIQPRRLAARSPPHAARHRRRRPSRAAGAAARSGPRGSCPRADPAGGHVALSPPARKSARGCARARPPRCEAAPSDRAIVEARVGAALASSTAALLSLRPSRRGPSRAALRRAGPRGGQFPLGLLSSARRRALRVDVGCHAAS